MKKAAQKKNRTDISSNRGGSPTLPMVIGDGVRPKDLTPYQSFVDYPSFFSRRRSSGRKGGFGQEKVLPEIQKISRLRHMGGKSRLEGHHALVWFLL